ncbi:hypothetical protein IFM89_011611 [Coptis chinensis]|uniref:Bet v I/Major latex protein domain-containing protein n=1 Tax=Coptis chinensis TaxID=261450 RepID=A0A835LDZ6_9MAGN|nr:hypothetical protein IFM89_011611 [Coptis chinensis]
MDRMRYSTGKRAAWDHIRDILTALEPLRDVDRERNPNRKITAAIRGERRDIEWREDQRGESGGSNSNSVTKEKIVAVDDKNGSITFEVMEGDPMLNSFKSFALRIHVTGNGERSFVKWSLEFEKANEDVPHPNLFLDLLAKVTKKLDAYLLKA